MLTPRGGWVVRPLTHRVTIKPHPQVLNHREDYFGNTIHAFSIEESHKQLVVTASGRVDVEYDDLPPPENTTPWETVRDNVLAQTDPRWLEVCQFRFNSGRIQATEDYAHYALPSFSSSRPILDAAFDLTQRIFRDFSYDPNATHVHTPTAEAFELRRGVCQDFAHIQISCLRSLGLCARYVSGYLKTHPKPGEKKLIGADQSHAWVSVYCGQQLGWVDLDPTNKAICNVDHIPIAWGRDYNDVIPIRGVFLGGGGHNIQVSVDVATVE
jgi:transglutaminase-like putative cysteine protease